MTIGEQLTAIARRMPDVYGRGKAAGFQEGYTDGYKEGVEDGGISGREVCLMNHYAATLLGSGEPYLEFQVPFEPDVVTIYSSNTYTNETPNCFKGLTVDFRGCGKYAAHIQYCSNTGQNIAATIRTYQLEDLFIYENGVWRFRMPGDQNTELRWHQNVRYNVIAVKYPEETAAGLLQEQIALLPDVPPAGSTGTLTYTQSCIDRYFTAQQWQELIATKPNWRFVMQ